MRVDTLSYNYQMNVNIKKVHEVIFKEQEQYFHSNGFLGEAFIEGAEITRTMPSKLGTTNIPASIQLSKLSENEIELTTTYIKGGIVQRYVLNELSYSKTQVIYSEKNVFHQLRNQYSFFFLAVAYKFFYNRGIKKRMAYLESQCNEKAGDVQ
ncbi:hypothetical protein [Enterococcus sp. AZ196]|uniref:hypothetical protein n=1 Tax=Enterococcus sp. AZ196 TaxID=2774659 RepID=UPI003D284055